MQSLVERACYRMHLRSTISSRQHALLLDLEAAGQEVYSEPMLHQPEELNDAYLHRSVRPRYFWIRSVLCQNSALLKQTINQQLSVCTTCERRFGHLDL